MSDTNNLPPLGYTPDPLKSHRVMIEFDVLARSQAEADHIVAEVLIEDLAGPPDALRTEGERVFGEDFGGNVASITSWIPTSQSQQPELGSDVVPSPGWESLEGSGIPEIVAEMFPPEPRADDFRLSDGSADYDGFEDAHDQWRDTCLSLAVQASRLPETLERLRITERVRDGLMDLLERESLPVEPNKADYLVTIAPSFEGEYEGARFSWDHTQWRSDFTVLAYAREQALRGLLVEGGPRTMYLPPRFHREWVPADLLAIQTLREVIEHDKSGHGVPLLDRAQQERLDAILFAADPDVTIPNPDDPESPEIYTGPASEAHAWLPPGVYDATGADGQGEFRVVVGRAPVGNSVTASAAFPPVEHDSTVLNEVARILEQDTEHYEPGPVLQRVNAAILSTGRTGAAPTTTAAVIEDPPLTRLERGLLLSDFLTEREGHLDTGPDDPEHPTTRPSKHREL